MNEPKEQEIPKERTSEKGNYNQTNTTRGSDTATETLSDTYVSAHFAKLCAVDKSTC
jgi:hypothetical protein